MSIIKCFTEHGRADLQSKFEEAVKGGKNEFEAARDILYDAHEKLHGDVNKLRTELKLPTQEYAIPERSTTKTTVDETSRNSEKVGGGVPQPKESTNAQEESQGEETGIAHAATEEVRKKYKLGNYERNNATDAELNEAAEVAIKKGYNPETLVEQMEKGIPPTGTENFILKKYLATLQAKFEKDTSDANLDKIQRLVKATDKIGSLQSEAFRTRKGLEPVEDSRADFFITELAANNDAPLTEGQKKTANEEYEKLTEARQKLDEDQKALDQKVAAFRAEQELAKTKKSVSTGKKRTHEDLAKERETILKNIGDKWKGAGKDVLSSDIPYRAQLFAIAPDVARLVKNLAEDGVIKLEEVVKNIHGKLKEYAPDLQEKDVHDIIAGEYNKKQGTKKEAAIVAENLRIEAQLINKLDRLENGTLPKNEKGKRQRNQQIHELRKKIGQHRRENPDYEGKLNQLTERNKTETERIKDKIENGEFESEAKGTPLLKLKELQKKFPEAFAKAVKSKDELIKVKRQIELRRIKQQYDNMNKYQRFGIGFVKALNVPRTLMASIDFSAPLRQGLVASIAHPVLAARAFKFMIQSAKNERTYNRWIEEVHNSPQWETAKQSGLAITDPNTLHLKDKEEAFLGSQYAEVVPFVKGSERAYVGYLNKLRWDLFNQYTNAISAKGKTFENNPEMYKAYATFVNSATGRGNLGFLEAGAPVLNGLLFSPRLIASRFNLLTNWLNPVWYKNTPANVKGAYVRDMLTFIGVGTGIMFMAKAMGADVEDDPRSSDFGKIKSGDQRWDIWGGFQPYVRLVTQLATGQKKSVKTGEIYDMDENKYGRGTRWDALINFGRGKLAPIPSVGVDLLSKTTGNPREKVEYNFDLNPDNNDVSFTNEAIRHIAPLLGQDVIDAMRGDQGVKAVYTVLPASLLGVGTQNYGEKADGGRFGGGGGAKGHYKPNKQKSKKATKQ